jgi:hypothetical protein
MANAMPANSLRLSSLTLFQAQPLIDIDIHQMVTKPLKRQSPEHQAPFLDETALTW